MVKFNTVNEAKKLRAAIIILLSQIGYNKKILV